MTRREVAGILIILSLVLAGRLIRQGLLCDPIGRWREPGWLEAHLPPLPVTPEEPVRTAPRLPSKPLDPNTCPADSLQLLPGVGPAIASRIMAARAAGLHFACARDMQAIRGIGPRTTARLEPYLVFRKPDSALVAGGHPAR